LGRAGNKSIDEIPPLTFNEKKFIEVIMNTRNITLLLILILSIGILSGRGFDPYYFQSKTIVASFKLEAIGNSEGKINFSHEDGYVKTGIKSFDILAQKYNITDMEQMHPQVKDPTWHDGKGWYLQNIYRLTLASDLLMDAAVAELEKDPNLNYAEFETINRTYFVPNDPMIAQQYALPRMRLFEAWDYVMGSYDVLVGITDSGVKWNHPDLRNNIWINPAESHNMSLDWDNGLVVGGDGVNDNGGTYGKIDDLIGWDFFNNDNNPMQNWSNNDHGTHVAGCAGAVGHNGIGVSGTSPIVSILSCKGASNTSNSTGITNGYGQLQYAAELGAHILNASWGGPGNGSYANNIVNYCTNMGALVVTAAGNANTEHGVGGYSDYPADCTNALCVAATNGSDYKSSFSDYGAPIDVCAPGEGIMSTIIAGNGYAGYDGTSMASPLVAGVAAMVKSLHPAMLPTEIKQRIEMTADYIDHLNPNYAGKLGTGRVNAFAATMYDKIPYIIIDDVSVEEAQGDGDGVPNPGEQVRIKIQLQNYMDPYSGLAWANATNLQTRLRCTYPGVTVIDSTASYGNLSSGSSMWNNTEPFKIQTISGLPSEPIPFELVLSSNQSATFPYNVTLPFNVNLSLVQAGFPYVLNGASQSSPILADVNQNGTREIVFADHLGNIHALTADGSNQLPGFPVNTGANVVGSLAMSNLTGDPNLKVFVASLSNNNITAITSAGNALWTVPSPGTLRSGPIIADLASDGNRKVIATTQNQYLIVLNSDGTDYGSFPITLGGAFLAPPAVADLNGDGVLDIICVTLNGSLHAINPLTAQNLTGFPVTLPGGSQNPITIANLDADPQPEILVATSSSGHLLAYNHDGSLMFQKNIGGQIKSGAIFADVNNNGSKEIILPAYSGDIWIMNADGSNVSGFPMNIGNNTDCSPVVARFDGSNQAGVIIGDVSGKLHSIRVDGTQSPNFPITVSGNLKISPAVGQLDNDGDLEIVLPNDTGMLVIDVKRPMQSLEWMCYLGSYNRAGNAYQTTPVAENTVPALQTGLGRNYPNPFNPVTTINYSLKNNSPVEIEIYNTKGQRVKTLVNKVMPAGNHKVQWNGLDDNGASVSSGVYFYRMHADGYSSTQKMVLMK